MPPSFQQWGLVSQLTEACGNSVGFLVLTVCAEKSRRLFGARSTSADFQVPFCFLQQGISYSILSSASPYKVEAADFAIKTPETQ